LAPVFCISLIAARLPETEGANEAFAPIEPEIIEIERVAEADLCPEVAEAGFSRAESTTEPLIACTNA
tara:strand:+ start:342 stop:545 length:204 start_codon:yes stop_codon:yes gene_type:complete